MMKTAIYALTPQGVSLGLVLKKELGADLFVSARFGERDSEQVQTFDNLVPFVGAVYTQYDQHIFIAATGIAVRAVAPLLQGKDKDPAIVALDHRGRFAISLVSGHLGGANALARRIAAITAGQAVITTATDTEDLPALDVLAKERGLAIADLDVVRAVNIALLAGDIVNVYDPYNHLGLKGISSWQSCFRFVENRGSLHGPGVLVSYNKYVPVEDILLLYPACLTVGIGCKRGVSGSDIKQAVSDIFARYNLAVESILAFASITLKSDESGLLEMASSLGRGLFFYPPSDLKAVSVPNPSQQVDKETGTSSVAEAAALLCADTQTLLVEKTVCNNITVAVALVP